MKSPLPFFATALLASLTCLRADSVLQPNDVLAICGDSITQQKIYSAYIEDYLLMCEPVSGVRVVQFGWGGERTGVFLTRIKSDVLPFKPTVVTTCYGMNDGNYRPVDDVTTHYYEDPTQKIIETFKANGVRQIVLGSPGCVDTKSFKRLAPEVYNHTLDTLRGIDQKLAQKDGLIFADVFTPMKDVMAKAQAAFGSDYVFIGGDGIHPGGAGHLVMAYAFLKGLGCDGAIGTITVDLGTGQATGTPGQKIVSCDNGSVTVESTRYPFCFQGDPDKPANTTASVLKFFPFNDDLNRYVLVVKGIKGTKAKVTWGGVTKEFAAADLAKGINLAAAFLVNPFSGAFVKVDAAVQTQQAFETTFVREYLHNADDFKAMLPDEAESLDRIGAEGIKRDGDLFAAAQKLVVPVQHTIKIEAE
jgi:lysophospholipase L1-like esterase